MFGPPSAALAKKKKLARASPRAPADVAQGAHHDRRRVLEPDAQFSPIFVRVLEHVHLHAVVLVAHHPQQAPGQVAWLVVHRRVGGPERDLARRDLAFFQVHVADDFRGQQVTQGDVHRPVDPGPVHSVLGRSFSSVDQSGKGPALAAVERELDARDLAAPTRVRVPPKGILALPPRLKGTTASCEGLEIAELMLRWLMT